MGVFTGVAKQATALIKLGFNRVIVVEDKGRRSVAACLALDRSLVPSKHQKGYDAIMLTKFSKSGHKKGMDEGQQKEDFEEAVKHELLVSQFDNPMEKPRSFPARSFGNTSAKSREGLFVTFGDRPMCTAKSFKEGDAHADFRDVRINDALPRPRWRLVIYGTSYVLCCQDNLTTLIVLSGQSTYVDVC